MTHKRTCSSSVKRWKLPLYKREWQHICAIMPAYLDDGTNGTRIVYVGGQEEYVPNRLSWVLDDLLGYLRTSRDVLAGQSKLYVGDDARRVPLIVSEQFCLSPVKGREELAKGDGTVGYVVLRHLLFAQEHAGKRSVKFIGGPEIEVLDSMRTLCGNLQLTHDLKGRMLWESTQSQSAGA